jgi:hypothetical protein
VRFANLFSAALIGALGFGAACTHAGPEVSAHAARLSAALEGTLDSNIGEAGPLDHRVDDSSIMPRPGRSAEYRQRVALEMQTAAQSRANTHLVANDR